MRFLSKKLEAIDVRRRLDGFNPDETRDAHGMWTNGGGSEGPTHSHGAMFHRHAGGDVRHHHPHMGPSFEQPSQMGAASADKEAEKARFAKYAHLTPGLEVKLKDPVDAGERAARYRVLENNGDRLLVQVSGDIAKHWAPGLVPTQVMSAEHFEPAGGGKSGSGPRGNRTEDGTKKSRAAAGEQEIGEAKAAYEKAKAAGDERGMRQAEGWLKVATEYHRPAMEAAKPATRAEGLAERDRLTADFEKVRKAGLKSGDIASIEKAHKEYVAKVQAIPAPGERPADTAARLKDPDKWAKGRMADLRAGIAKAVKPESLKDRLRNQKAGTPHITFDRSGKETTKSTRFEPLDKSETDQAVKTLSKIAGNPNDPHAETANKIIENTSILTDGGNGMEKPTSFDRASMRKWMDKVTGVTPSRGYVPAKDKQYRDFKKRLK